MAALTLRFTLGHHQNLARQEVTVTQLRAVCRLGLFAAVLLLGSHGFTHAQPEVDLALVLAVDTSSIDTDEVDLTDLLGGGELHRRHNAIYRHYFIPPALAAFSPLEALWSKLPCRRSLPCETPIPSAGWPRS
jgi:hypothetical protein